MITIAGPTAVGKTDLTIKLAQRLDSDIFSADSRQVYRELSIGTAKPELHQLSQVKHHFIDHISIHDDYNVSIYETEIDRLFDTYFKTRDIGIMTGGTGMYFKAALEGLDYFPDVDPTINAFYESVLENEGIAVLQTEIQEKDPDYAQEVDLANPRRLIRALSIIRSSGKPFSSFLNKKEEKQLPFTPIKICLTRDREELYSRINTRVDLMMEAGLLEEVKKLVPWQHLKSMQTVGYSELFKFLNGEIALSEAVELIKRNSRRYAKRQMTWFRNQGSWAYMDANDPDAIVEFIECKIGERS